MDEIKDIVENIIAKENNLNLINREASTEQLYTDKSGSIADKYTQTSNGSYILISVGQDNYGYRYTTWKVLLDTENVFEMHRQFSKRDTSTQTSSENFPKPNENDFKIECMCDICSDDSSEWSDLIKDKVKKTNPFDDNEFNFKNKKKRTRKNYWINSDAFRNNLYWRRRDLCEDPNNNSYNACMTNHNAFSIGNSDSEEFEIHDSETLILSPESFRADQINIPFCETPVDTNISSNEFGNCVLDNCNCDSGNDNVDDLESKEFTSELGNLHLNGSEKSNPHTKTIVYDKLQMYSTDESECSDESMNKEATEQDFDETTQIITVTKKPLKKITLDEYRRRIAERANASKDNTQYEQNS